MTGFVLGVELDGDGAHPSAWRASGSAPGELVTGRLVAARAQRAERAGFAFATFDDAPTPPATGDAPRLRADAVLRAAYAAPLTSAIGLVPTVHGVYGEPFHLGTQLASLDFASHGRGGWLVSADSDPRSAAVYGRPAVSEADAARLAADSVEVARRLWLSWEADAVIADVSTGRYLDRERVHYIDFAGDDYRITGPAIGPRPPQELLPVFGPAALVESARLDVAVFTVASAEPGERIAAATALASTLRSRGAALAVLDLEVALDAAGLPAASRIAALDEHSPWVRGGARFVGGAGALVELLTALATVVDGVRLHPAVLDVDLEELERAVIPALRARIPVAVPRPGDTLRSTLGLAAVSALPPADRLEESA
ncbi:LLM class flavin-dependent oxidoreductase [Leifsonia sp. ZF2019]|uniref:LLM class flavin-dependent oxidoreductase n=1 Tax=Leifsonia sp. ZF2019 TaxID=2781978 RepID=UPI001CC15C1F|nr:LLM class flavin-dependent oxidoreductase [Leifsonia sp. ZF2019]UAJ81074.1 LLM class flavin-dependent oxidoreductase [Leifsonia sp. ZF2019]